MRENGLTRCAVIDVGFAVPSGEARQAPAIIIVDAVDAGGVVQAQPGEAVVLVQLTILADVARDARARIVGSVPGTRASVMTRLQRLAQVDI